MADFKDEILDIYKGENEPVFKLIPVDDVNKEYKIQLMNNIAQDATPFAKSSIATPEEALDNTNDDKILSSKSIASVLELVDSNDKSISEIYNKVFSNEKSVTELLMQAEIDSKVLGDNMGKYYVQAGEEFSYSNGEVDNALGYIIGSLSSGSGTIVLTDFAPETVIEDFVAGDEITIQDASNKEVVIITSSSTKTIVIDTNTVNSYTNPLIYRSLIVDTSSNYRIANTGGSVDVPTFDGNIVEPSNVRATTQTIAVDNFGSIYVGYLDNSSPYNLVIEKSTDRGSTFTQLPAIGFIGNGSAAPSYDIGFDSNNLLHVVFSEGTSAAQYYHRSFDGSTWTSSHSIGDYGWQRLGFFIDSNDYINISYTQDYSSDQRVMFARSTDSGVNWSTPTIVEYNSTYNAQFTSVAVDTSGGIVVSYGFSWSGSSASTQVAIKRSTNGGTSFATRVLINYSPSYVQRDTSIDYCALTDKFVIAYRATLSGSSELHMWRAYSTDNGVSIAGVSRLTYTSGFNYGLPSVAFAKGGDDYILFGRSSVDIYQSVNGGAPTLYVDGAYFVVSEPRVCKNYDVISTPVGTFYGNSAIRFKGVGIRYNDTGFLNPDIRLNIYPFSDSQNLSAFTYHNKKISDIDGKVSIVGTSDDESYIDMTDTLTTIDSTNEETLSFVQVTTADTKVTLKLTATRANGIDVATIDKIYGGVD